MLIILNATTGGVCIMSHATVVGAPIVLASTTGIIKGLLKRTRNKKNSMIKFLY